MAAPHPSLPLRAIDALKRGDTIEAIKILRAATPLDLKTAKDVVEAFRRGGMTTASHRAAPLPGSAAAARRSDEQAGVADRMRKASGFGLAQPQDTLATSRFRDHPHGPGGRSPGEVPRSGPTMRWIVVIALAGYALYTFAVRAIHV